MEMTPDAPPPSAPPPEPSAGGFEIAGRRIVWTPKEVLFGVLAVPVAALVVALIVVTPFALAFDDGSREIDAVLVLSGIPVYAAAVAIVFFLSSAYKRGGWHALGFERPTSKTLRWAIAALAGAFAIAYLYGAIILVFDLDFLEQACDDQIPLDIRNDALLLALTAIVVVLAAPLAEELFLRGFVFPGLGRQWGATAGVLLSGAIFGLAHLAGGLELIRTVPVFASIGMVFAISYHRSGNLLSPIGAHFVFNLTSTIFIASTTCNPNG